MPLFFAACFAIVFAHGLLGGFVYDDVRWIEENAALRVPANALGLFGSDYFAVSQETSYRPVVTLSYFLDHAVFGLRPFGFRLHNLLLHLAVCLLLWQMLHSLVKSKAAAWWGVFLYCFHPIQVEAVIVPSMREEMQCALFLLLAWLLLARGGHWFWAAGSYALALLSKETALFFPFVAAAAGFWGDAVMPWGKDRRMRLKVLASLGAVTVAYAVLRFAVFRNPVETAFPFLGGSLGSSLLTHFTAWTHGVICLFAPQNLTVDAWLPTQRSPWNIMVMGCAVAWLVLGFFAVWTWKYNRMAAFGFIWFLGALMPVSGVVPIVNAYADRYFYIPLMGLAMIVAALAAKMNVRAKKIMAPLGVGVLSMLAVMTYHRVGVFHDNTALWTDALNKLGRKPWPLSLVLRAPQRQSEPLQSLQQRTVQEPNNPEPWTRLACAYWERGDTDNAVRAFEISLQIDPGNPNVHLMQGDAFARMGKTTEALRHYQVALSLNPQFAEAHNNRGVLYLEQKQYPLAHAEFSKALAIRPDFTAALCNMATLHADQKDYQTAITLWEKVLMLDKTNGPARWNLQRLKGMRQKT